MSVCKSCEGQGQVFIRQGFMTIGQTCPHCQGSGQSSTRKCPDCSGDGFHLKKANLDITIPEGVNSGNRLRVSQEGNIGKSSERGDLYVIINVAEDEYFIRDEDNLYIKVPIFFTQIALGTTIKIAGLKGELELTVPKGTADKEQFIFKNEGVKNVQHSQKGHLVAQIEIIYPKTLDKEQEELLNKLNESFGFEANSHETTFETITDKIKNWFK
jgi:molecular chaperone DnaJ